MGVHAVVVWQTLHSLVVTKWPLFLPVAPLPLWQVEQEPVTPL